MPPFLLPSELIDVVAYHVFDDGRYFQRPTINACMLVNKEFAAEFRKYHFRVLSINEACFHNDPERARYRLKEWRDVLVKNPTYKPLVTRVVLALTPGSQISPFTDEGNWLHLKALLEELHNIQMVEINSNNRNSIVLFHQVSGRMKKEILRLCALPSVKAISLKACLGISPRVILDAPNLSSLRLQKTIMFNTWDEETVRSAGVESSLHDKRNSVHLFLVGANELEGLTEFLGRVTNITAFHEDDQSMMRAAAEAASLTGSLRVLGMVFTRNNWSHRSFSGPLRISLAGAHDIRDIHLVLEDTMADDPYALVDGLNHMLESLPKPSKLEHIGMIMKELESMAFLMPPDHEYQYESGDEETTDELDETDVAAATSTLTAPPALASMTPPAGLDEAPSMTEAELRPAPRSLHQGTPVPWSKLVALVSDKASFPVLQSVTLTITIGDVDEDTDTDFEEWGTMYKRLENVFEGMGGIGYLMWDDADADNEDG